MAMAISRLGDCEIRRLIAHGGFSDVYLGRHPVHGDVAVKLHHVGWEMRAMQSDRIMASLRHPGVVRVYSTERDPRTQQLFTVMEYVSLPTLADILERQPTLPPATTIAILREIALILDYVYRHSEVRAHRDIKPENVFVDLDGTRVRRVRLTDFGTVRVQGGNRTTAAFGDPDYNPPEQIRNEAHLYGPATDIYAMGCMAYRMLTGRPPYRGDTMAKLRGHLNGPIPLVSAAAGVGLQRLIARCMAKHPRQRFASMREFIAALDALSASSKAAGTLEGRAGQADESRAGLPLGFWLGLALTLLMTFIVLALGAIAFVWPTTASVLTAIVMAAVWFLTVLVALIGGAIWLLADRQPTGP